MITRLTYWSRCALGGAGFATAVAYVAALHLSGRRPGRTRRDFARLMSRLVCPATGVRLRISGRHHLQPGRPCVYVSNHQSYLDYPILGSVFPEDTVVLARQVGDLPLLGWLFRATGNIAVERDVPIRAAAAVDEALAALRRGESVWIFPEGTRDRSDGELGRFRRGAFRIAAQTGAPLVPVLLSPLRPRTDLEGGRLERNEAEIRVLEPVLPRGAGAEEERDLLEEVRRRMAAALAAMRAGGREPGDGESRNQGRRTRS